jgi:hypothetical protein
MIYSSRRTITDTNSSRKTNISRWCNRAITRWWMTIETDSIQWMITSIEMTRRLIILSPLKSIWISLSNLLINPKNKSIWKCILCIYFNLPCPAIQPSPFKYERIRHSRSLIKKFNKKSSKSILTYYMIYEKKTIFCQKLTHVSVWFTALKF